MSFRTFLLECGLVKQKVYSNLDFNHLENKMIVQYVRDSRRNPIGCVVAIKHEDGRIILGVSLHNPKDKWDRDLAVKIAIGRSYCDGVMPEVPHSKQKYVMSAMLDVIERSKRYFKTPNVQIGYQDA